MKRSLGVKYGFFKNSELFSAYSTVVDSDPEALNNARKGLKKFLNNHTSKFIAELNTTFGQILLPKVLEQITLLK